MHKVRTKIDVTRCSLDGEQVIFDHFLTIFGLVVTLTFNRKILSSSFQNCSEVANLVKFPQTFSKICLLKWLFNHIWDIY